MFASAVRQVLGVELIREREAQTRSKKGTLPQTALKKKKELAAAKVLSQICMMALFVKGILLDSCAGKQHIMYSYESNIHLPFFHTR
jgi:hypothetical protein